jgi:peptide/nickel transport system ATP-binding protein
LLLKRLEMLPGVDACPSYPIQGADGVNMVDSPLLSIEDLAITVGGNGGHRTPVAGVTLSVAPGEMVALVGGPGSGKTLTSLAAVGLLSCSFGRVTAGRLLFRRRAGNMVDMATLSAEELRLLRGAEIAMVFQEPMTSLNPLVTVGEQIAEVIRRHKGADRTSAWIRAERMLSWAEIPKARQRSYDYPQQIAGELRQRVMIALAMACEPVLLVADEQTTLDAAAQTRILHLLDRLRRETGMGVLLASRDVDVVAPITDRIAAIHAGRIVETDEFKLLSQGLAAPGARALTGHFASHAIQPSDG